LAHVTPKLNFGGYRTMKMWK